MPGTLQVGGNTVITHTGDAGAGTNTINNAVVFPAGHIIQIVQAVKNDVFVGANNTNEQLITGYNCAITPHKSASKILINYSFDTSAASTLTARSYIERDIGGGGYSKLTGMMGNDGGGSAGDPSLSHAGVDIHWMMYKHAGMYLDSPSYSLGNAITYRIGIQSEASGVPVYVGTTQRDSTQYHPRTASILVLMEVSQ
tara:strand:+ start:61 stop:654 length:594 start_codon:yes stop_codon:yes gene_type:complete